MIEHLEQNSLRPILHCNKLLEFVQYLLGVDNSGHLRAFTDFLRSDNYSSTAGRRPLPSRRLADLQDKRPANLNLSLSELLNSKWDLGFLSRIFLSWDA